MMEIELLQTAAEVAGIVWVSIMAIGTPIMLVTRKNKRDAMIMSHLTGTILTMTTFLLIIGVSMLPVTCEAAEADTTIEAGIISKAALAPSIREEPIFTYGEVKFYGPAQPVLFHNKEARVFYTEEGYVEQVVIDAEAAKTLPETDIPFGTSAEELIDHYGNPYMDVVMGDTRYMVFDLKTYAVGFRVKANKGVVMFSYMTNFLFS